MIAAAPGWYSGVLCPISIEATFGETPAWSSHVAAVWRDSCSPIGSSPSSIQRAWTRFCTNDTASSPDLLGRFGGHTLPSPGRPCAIHARMSIARAA